MIPARVKKNASQTDGKVVMRVNPRRKQGLAVRGIHTEKVCYLKWSLLAQIKSSSCNGCRSFVFERVLSAEP